MIRGMLENHEDSSKPEMYRCLQISFKMMETVANLRCVGAYR